MWSLDDLPIFLAVVEHNGVTAAAVALGLSKSTVSKALQRLEDAMSLRLMERNSRNIRLTTEGEVFYRQGLAIMEQVQAANHLMGGLSSSPVGPLTVALPIAFAREYVAPRLPQFHQRYPKVDLEIIMTSQSVDIIRDQIDLAVVVGGLVNSELIARTLIQSQLIWVSSPSYVATHEFKPTTESLKSHIQVIESRYSARQFPLRIEEKKQSIDLVTGVVRINDPIAVREAVLNGAGVAPLPHHYCQRLLNSGELVQVYDQIECAANAATLSVVYPSRRFMSNKARAFLDFLIEIAESIPSRCLY